MDQKRKKEIGRRVDYVRKTLLNNISKNQLAKEINMSGQNLGFIISGKGTFAMDKLINFCEYAKVSSDYILWGKEYNLIDVEKVKEALIEYNNKKI